MGITVLFVFPLYYLYDGERSGTIIAQFSTIVSIMLEFTVHWKPRIYFSIPLWVLLVPASIYATLQTSGREETIFYTASLLALTIAQLLINKKRALKLQQDG